VTTINYDVVDDDYGKFLQLGFCFYSLEVVFKHLKPLSQKFLVGVNGANFRCYFFETFAQ